jgi:hypothetical protein
VERSARRAPADETSARAVSTAKARVIVGDETKRVNRTVAIARYASRRQLQVVAPVDKPSEADDMMIDANVKRRTSVVYQQ